MCRICVRVSTFGVIYAPYHQPTHQLTHFDTHTTIYTGQPFERPLNEKGEMVPSSDHGLWGFTRYVTGADCCGWVGIYMYAMYI